MISLAGIAAQLTELALAVLLAPLLTGWVNQCRAWLQNKSAPSLVQPYRMLAKLFQKEVVLAHNASPLFRTAPYLIFGCLCVAAAIVPTLGTDLPLNAAADAIALVGLLALARMFIALAGMDVGTAFGSLGARREMLVGFLAEPALLMVLFTASLISNSTSLATIVEALARREFVIYPSMAFLTILPSVRKSNGFCTNPMILRSFRPATPPPRLYPLISSAFPPSFLPSRPSSSASCENPMIPVSILLKS